MKNKKEKCKCACHEIHHLCEHEIKCCENMNGYLEPQQPPIIEENAFEPEDRKKCDTYLDHKPVWVGDCFACRKCGLIFIPSVQLAAQKEEILKLKPDWKEHEKAECFCYTEGINLWEKRIKNC